MDIGYSQTPLAEPHIGGIACTGLTAPIVPAADVLQMSAEPVYGLSLPSSSIFDRVDVQNLNFCNVSMTLTHPGDNDIVYITVWLPLTDWNGRYQATGGGGLAAGYDWLLMNPVASGYAASSTDAGLTLNQTVDPQGGTWALNPDGSFNEPLVLNLAWRSIHDMAVVSKALIKQFYGENPEYSYWTGCSQGGRQGYAAAAKYPEDFDGILAVAPAIGGVYFAPADYWPPVVMHNEHEVPPFCVFEEYQKAIVAECDPLDGVRDGLISDWDVLESCPFDPAALIGTVITCDDQSNNITVTASHANIVSKILDGPQTPAGERLWYGLAPGASFSATAKTVKMVDGTWAPEPFKAAESWVKFLTMRNASYDITKMTYSDYFKAFEASTYKMRDLFGDEQLDFSGFQRAGGKLLTWVGLADQYIPPLGILQFRAQTEKKFGGPEAVDEFYRLFTAPGAGHCAGGIGPNPIDQFGPLIDWVEHGNAPDVLPASTNRPNGIDISRNLCRYPKKLVYQHGDVNKADSFTCE